MQQDSLRSAVGVLSVQESIVSNVVVPNFFIRLVEPPDFGCIWVIALCGRKKFTVAPIRYDADDLIVLRNSLHSSVGLDRLIVELFNVQDWCAIGVDAKCLPKKQTAMYVHQINHPIIWGSNIVTGHWQHTRRNSMEARDDGGSSQIDTQILIIYIQDYWLDELMKVNE